MFKRILYILLFLLAGVAAFAQQYPVQGSLAIASPYPANLSDYANSNIQNVVLNLTLTDLTLSNKRIRLKVFIQTQNATIAQSIDNVSGEPLIMLDGGIPQRFTNTELAHYFRLDNLQGINPDGYARSLPEGVYTISFEVYDYFTGNKLSGRIAQTFWIIINDPPLLNTPTDKLKIADFTSSSLGAGGIIFNWTPRSTQVTNTEYEFTLCELWDATGDPYQQFMSAIPKYQTTVSNTTTLIYGLSQPPLVSGYTYAWRVRAKAKAGFEDIGLYRNDGYSNLFTFRYGDPCPAPQSLALEAKTSDQISATWQAPLSTGSGVRYKLAYRKYSIAGQWNWAETETSDLFLNLSNLEPATEYELKVGVPCNNGNSTAPLSSGRGDGGEVVFTPSQRTTTLAAGQLSGIECGKEPVIDITNQKLLESLKVGDVVMANDFPTTITRVTGTSQGWSGEGWTKVPWLGDTRIHVTYASIKVNSDYKLIDGSFITTYDPTGKNIGDIDKTIDDAVGLYTGGTDVGKVVTGADATAYTVPYTITATDVAKSTFDTNGSGGGTITLGNGQTLTVSNLPTTVQDAAGTIYQADDKGKLTKVGSTSGNAGAMLAATNLTVVDASKGTVTFAPTSDMKYAFDAWQKAYDGNSAWSKRYETLPLSGGTKGGSYRVSSKLMVPGEADKVLAIINLNDKKLVADSVRFVNAKGTLFEKKKITNNSYELSLVGGPAGDAQEVYALYSTGGKTYTLGKLLVATYEPKTINLALVPVNDAALDSEAIARELKKVYEPLGIDFNLITKDNFKYKALETASLKVEGSGLLSVYTDQMKALNSAYAASLGSAYDAGTVYMFALKQGAGKDEGKTILGDMPRGKQFGYIFTQGQDGTSQGATAAHEIGHGIFQLQHTFSYSGMADATFSAANVMNYPAGEALSKLQWDLMHDQGLVISVFETDKGVEIKTDKNELIIDILQKIRCAYASSRHQIYVGSLDKYISGNFLYKVNEQLKTISITILLDQEKKYEVYSLAQEMPIGIINGTVVNYIFSDKIKISVPLADQQKFEYFIKSSSFELEYATLKQYIANDNAKSAIDVLYDYSYCVYEKLSADEKLYLLKALAEKAFLTENYEDMALNLIRSSSTSNNVALQEKVIEAIFSKRVERTTWEEINNHTAKTLFECFCDKMNDLNGEANYKNFVVELANLCERVYKQDYASIDKYFIENPYTIYNYYVKGVPLYFWNFKSGTSSRNGNEYSFFSDINQKENYMFFDGGRYNSDTHLYTMYANQMIYVYIGIDDLFVKKGTVLRMPAFMLSYLLEQEVTKIKANIANWGITLATLPIGGAELKGATILQKLLFAYDVTRFLVDDVFDIKYREYIESKFGEQGRIFNSRLDKINALIATYKAVKGFKNIAVDDIQAITSLFEAWDAIKIDLDTKVDKNMKAIEKMNELRKKLNTDEIIY